MLVRMQRHWITHNGLYTKWCSYSGNHLSICMWNLRVFLDDAPGCQCPFVLCLDPQDCLRVGFCHRVLIKSGPGNRGLLACRTTHEAMSRISSWDWPHLDVRQEGRERLPDKAGESNLLSRSRGEKSLRWRGSGNLGVLLKWDWYVGELLGSHQGFRVTFRSSIRKVGLLLRRCSGQGPHLAKTLETHGFSRVAAGFSSYDEYWEPARYIPLVTKVMRKEARHKQRRDWASGVPPDILEHLPPKNQSLPTLLLCALTSDFTGGCPPPPSHFLCQRVNLQLQLIKFLGN